MAELEEVEVEVEEPESTRDALEAAFDAAEEAEAPEVASEEIESRPRAESAEAPEGSTDSVTGDPKPDADPAGVQDPEGQAEQVAAEAERAPVGWRPAAREHWSKLPREVQDEISKREHDINVGMQRNSEAAQYGQQFNQMMQRFRPTFAATGMNDLQAVDRVMQTAAGLQGGSPVQKAQMVASMIKDYGVDIEALDSLLAGEEAPAGMQQNSAIDEAVRRAVEPFQNYISQQQQGQQQQHQQMAQESGQEVDAFANNPKNEFYREVRGDMADLLDLATKHGRELSIDQAYNRAVAARPDIQEVLAGRNSAASLEKKKVAASSVRGTPSGSPTNAAPDTLRGAIENAWDNAGLDGSRI